MMEVDPPHTISPLNAKDVEAGRAVGGTFEALGRLKARLDAAQRKRKRRSDARAAIKADARRRSLPKRRNKRAEQKTARRRNRRSGRG